MRRLLAFSAKLYGEPPEKGSPRTEQLRWVRGVHLRMLLLAFVAYAMLLIWAAHAWVLVIATGGVLTALASLISLSVRIRAEERRERD